MRKILLVVSSVLALSACTDFDFAAQEQAAIKENAENILGLIDPKQDWSSVNSGTLSVTADAPLYDVVKVQILTESPLYNKYTRVVAEAEATKGQTVSLNFVAPNTYDHLIAACVDSKGHYYIKRFNVRSTQLSFQAPAAARTRAVTRADNDLPNASSLQLEYKNSVQSYNALRTIFANEAARTGDNDLTAWVNNNNINLWEGKNWQYDRLWMPNNTSSTGSSWTVVNGTVLHDAEPIDSTELNNLLTIFSDFLDPKNNYRTRDNVELIRSSGAVQFYNNQLTSDGTTPITITPIQMQSSEIGSCHLYYYYYKDVPSGMSEEEYIKALPKFKAIQCWHTRSAANSLGYGAEDFFKVHEYMLPYYGDPDQMLAQKVLMSSFASTDGKVYRIRNGRQFEDKDYYMTYKGTGNSDVDKLDVKYSDDAADLSNQLWQIFTTNDGASLLYNIGSRYFLAWDSDWATTYTEELSKVKACAFSIKQGNDGNVQIWRFNNNSKGLGTDLGVKANKGIYSDKNGGSATNFDWYLEEYTGRKGNYALSDYEFCVYPEKVTSPSVIIPQGYRIGFIMRKLKGSQNYKDNSIVSATTNGCCYGFGGLNRELNNFPDHFSSSTTKFNMQEDDPRACIFYANGKIYMGFEDGCDAQYADLVIEIGGYDKTTLAEPPVGTEDKSMGVETSYLYDETEIEGASYTLCFEDRSIEADYDMNDVVLRCKRINTSEKYKNWVQLSLLAAGGVDNVVLHVGKSCAQGDELNNKEVHELFFVDQMTGEDRFVNTVYGQEEKMPITAYYELDEGMTIPQFLAQIYIENQYTGETIGVARQGSAPLGIIIPNDFQYPKEKESIVNAYATFRNWANQASMYRDWYENNVEGKVFPVDEVIKRIQGL